MSHVSKTAELLDLSRLMLQAAEEEEWDRVQEMETRRASLLSEYDAAAESAVDKAGMTAGLQEMLDINRRILERSVRARDEAQKNLGAVQRGIKADHAYRQNE